MAIEELHQAARDVLTELDIIREHRKKTGVGYLVVHVNTHEALRRALAAPAAEPREDGYDHWHKWVCPDADCGITVPRFTDAAAQPGPSEPGLPCCGHPAEEHMWSGGCCICRCPAARPTSAAAQPGPSEPGLRERLAERRYRHANIEGTDPANGQPMRVCATDRQAWPCEVVATIDEVLARLAAADSASGEGLDAAWAGVLAALPSRGWWVVAIEHNSDDEPPCWRAVEQSGRPHVYGAWAETPAAALHSLIAAVARHQDEHPEWRDEPLEGGSGA